MKRIKNNGTPFVPGGLSITGLSVPGGAGTAREATVRLQRAERVALSTYANLQGGKRGAILWHDGVRTRWIEPGTPGQVLTMVGGEPQWV